MAAGLESYIETYVHTFATLFTIQGKGDRLRTERAIVPDVIAEELLGNKTLPPEWLAFSPEVAAAFAMVAMDDGAGQLPFARRRPFTPEEICQSPRAMEVLTHAGLASDEERQAAVFDLFGTERPEHLRSASVKVEELSVAAASEPGAEDRKLGPADLAHSAAIDEVYRLFHAALDGPPETRIQLLHEAADLYPWSQFFQMELAIAYDTLQQDPERALKHITVALLLDPETAIHWHSFGVICRRLSLENEARIAAVVKEWLESSNQNSDKPA
jgi:tetratricopeptide (TPR) repeat protein